MKSKDRNDDEPIKIFHDLAEGLSLETMKRWWKMIDTTELPICFDGLSAWQVRRPAQVEILSFGLACFGSETAVAGRAS